MARESSGQFGGYAAHLLSSTVQSTSSTDPVNACWVPCMQGGYRLTWAASAIVLSPMTTGTVAGCSGTCQTLQGTFAGGTVSGVSTTSSTSFTAAVTAAGVVTITLGGPTSASFAMSVPGCTSSTTVLCGDTLTFAEPPPANTGGDTNTGGSSGGGSSGGSSGAGTAAVAGGVVGGVIAVALIGVAAYFFIARRRATDGHGSSGAVLSADPYANITDKAHVKPTVNPLNMGVAV
jgi:hypothetical protein